MSKLSTSFKRKPWENGIYLTKWVYGEFYCYWDGSFWYYGWRDLSKAIERFLDKDIAPVRNQSEFVSWRGLAEKPE